MDESRDSKDGTVEKEEVVASQSDAHTSDEGAERYGVRHRDRDKLGNGFPSQVFFGQLKERSRARRRQVDKPRPDIATAA